MGHQADILDVASLGETSKLRCGCIADPVDNRDLLKTPEEGELPEETTLREYCPAVYNQGDTGSCTGYASTYAATILMGKMLDKMGMPVSNAFRLAPYYNYYWARAYDTTMALPRSYDDNGATLRSAMKALKKKGCMRYELMPCETWSVTDVPPTPAFKTFQIKDYQRIPVGENAVEACKKVLAVERLPILFHFVIQLENWASDEVKRTGIYNEVENPENKTILVWHHALCMTGYKKINGNPYFEFINSWGSDWGDHGYGYFAENMVKSQHYIQDLWTFDKSYF